MVLPRRYRPRDGLDAKRGGDLLFRLAPQTIRADFDGFEPTAMTAGRLVVVAFVAEADDFAQAPGIRPAIAMTATRRTPTEYDRNITASRSAPDRATDEAASPNAA